MLDLLKISNRVWDKTLINFVEWLGMARGGSVLNF